MEDDTEYEEVIVGYKKELVSRSGIPCAYHEVWKDVPIIEKRPKNRKEPESVSASQATLATEASAVKSSAALGDEDSKVLAEESSSNVLFHPPTTLANDDSDDPTDEGSNVIEAGLISGAPSDPFAQHVEQEPSKDTPGAALDDLVALVEEDDEPPKPAEGKKKKKKRNKKKKKNAGDDESAFSELSMNDQSRDFMDESQSIDGNSPS